jgi:hypothetical protein
MLLVNPQPACLPPDTCLAEQEKEGCRIIDAPGEVPAKFVFGNIITPPFPCTIAVTYEVDVNKPQLLILSYAEGTFVITPHLPYRLGVVRPHMGDVIIKIIDGKRREQNKYPLAFDSADVKVKESDQIFRIEVLDDVGNENDVVLLRLFFQFIEEDGPMSRPVCLRYHVGAYIHSGEIET